MAIEMPEYMRTPPPQAAPGREGLPKIDVSQAIAIADDDEDYGPAWIDAIETTRAADADADNGNAVAVFTLLGRDDRLVRLVAVWPMLGLKFEAPMRCEPTDMAPVELLARCWQKIWNPGNQTQAKEVLPNMVASAAGITLADAGVILRVGIQSRLIYPHGKIHLAAAHFLRAEAVATLLTRGAAIIARAKK